MSMSAQTHFVHSNSVACVSNLLLGVFTYKGPAKQQWQRRHKTNVDKAVLAAAEQGAAAEASAATADESFDAEPNNVPTAAAADLQTERPPA